jgi:hypothetical protein
MAKTTRFKGTNFNKSKVKPTALYKVKFEGIDETYWLERDEVREIQGRQAEEKDEDEMEMEMEVEDE